MTTLSEKQNKMKQNKPCNPLWPSLHEDPIWLSCNYFRSLLLWWSSTLPGIRNWFFNKPHVLLMRPEKPCLAGCFQLCQLYTHSLSVQPRELLENSPYVNTGKSSKFLYYLTANYADYGHISYRIWGIEIIGGKIKNTVFFT